MSKNKISILKNMLNLVLDDYQKESFEKYENLFFEYNSHTNLISKNDEKYLFEKHIFDSLALSLFLKDNSINNMLDVGTGGGFPSLPVSILFKDINVFALDSTQKKLNFINIVKKELKLKNIQTLWTRVENLDKKYLKYFDLVTSRAVGKLDLLINYALPYIKENGYFVAFKSKNAENELEEAKNTMQKLNFKLEKIIDYNLPLEENFERKLIILKRI